jgi:Fe-S-cluster containining protein
MSFIFMSAFFYVFYNVSVRSSLTMEEKVEKKFPVGMVPLCSEKFQFSCHDKVACFTKCCKNVDMLLFPYDILRLKIALKIDSEGIMRKYTRVVKGDNPYFPSVMLKLQEENGWCPFLTEKGCTVYDDRPSSCRTYPLERAVERNTKSVSSESYYFLTNHDYCLGHKEDKYFLVKEWIRNQRIDPFNLMNDLWTEVDTLFAANPWRGEGSGGEKQRLAFMVCYDLDNFRGFAVKHSLLKRFRLSKDQRRRIDRDDSELLKFGFEWLKYIFSGKSSLIQK